jgi:4'-phosphopantetheinyl transferase
MRELGALHIHLWQYPIGKPPDARHLAHARTILSDPEKQRCAAFRSDRHQTEYALSRAMLRLALSEYAPVAPQDWQFLALEKGKPEIAGPALTPPLWFNLSHTDGFSACVIGRVRQLGVDIENMNREMPHQELAKRFFAPGEFEYLLTLPPSLQREAFFRIWTLKEAYIKAEGKGLSIPLDSFHFRFSTGNPELKLTAESNPRDWSVFEFQPGPDHRISIVVKNPEQRALEVRCYHAAILFDQM